VIHALPRDTPRPDLYAAIATIAAGAAERDRDPSGAFPTGAMDTLTAAGAMQVTAGPNPVSSTSHCRPPPSETNTSRSVLT